MHVRSVVGFLLSLATSGFTTLAVGSPQVGAPSCSTELANPYQSNPAALAACGLKTFPLIAASRMVDGGTEYKYLANGQTIMYRVPPQGFNPLSADSTQLARYAMPERPTQPGELQRWKQKMQHIQPVDPPRFLVQTSLHAATSNSWSGYVATAGPFTKADTEYIEPALGDPGSGCSVNAVMFWSGLGGWNGDQTLGQGGTFEGQNISVAGLSNHQAWTEVIPNSAVGWNLWATQGQQFEAITSHANGLYEHWLQNIYTGRYIDAFEGGSYTGSSADFIVERPQTGPNSWTNLSNFGTVSFQQALANGVAIANKSPQSITMYTWHSLATPSGLSGAFSQFSVTRNGCS